MKEESNKRCACLWRHCGLTVRALDLKYGGSGFKSSSMPQDGFVFADPRFNFSTLVNSRLVCLPPVGIFNKFLFLFLFNLQDWFAYSSVHN